MDLWESIRALFSDPFYSLLFVGVGLIILYLETFIPSGGILGCIALGCMVFGIGGLYAQGHPVIATGAIVICCALSYLGIRFGLARLAFKESLSSGGSQSTDASIVDLMGKRGTTVTELRPAGVAKIDGRHVDVVTEGTFVERGVEIEVVDNSENRVVVRPLSLPKDPSMG